MGSDWTTLTGCLVLLIAERLLANDVTDYIRFRAVCNSWRQHTEDPRVNDGLEPKYLPRSWIMLEEAPPALFRHRFLNTNSGGVITVDMPELEYCDVMGPTLGGLLTLRERGSHGLYLFNPFTSHVTELPPLTTLLHSVAHDPTLVEPEYHQPTAIGLSDGASAVAIFCKLVDKVAVARPGESRWRWISVRSRLMQLAASLGGYFYLVSRTLLFQLRSGGDGANGQPRLTAVADVPNAHPTCRLGHTLVENDDDDNKLTLVKKIFYWPQGREVPPEGVNALTMPRVCVVYTVDMAARMVLPSWLGGRALFVGDDRAVRACPRAFYPNLAAGTVYTGRADRLFTVDACRVEPDAGPLKVVLHAHSLERRFTEQSEIENDESEVVNPKGIVEVVSSYVGSDRGGSARPPLYMAGHIVNSG